MLDVTVTKDPALVRQAQELRYRVFAGEWRARLSGAASGLDEDRFDSWCDHLVVRDGDLVVGTYRMLPPGAAAGCGGYYAEERFDLAPLDLLRDRMVEAGRACVDPRYRAGTVMLLMWSALARYLVESGHDYVFDSASVGLADGGHEAASIYHRLAATHLSPDDCRVVARNRLPLETLCDTREAAPPPLLRGYLNLGAWLCGEPAWDRAFGCADFPILLPLARMHGRYARHFLAQAA